MGPGSPMVSGLVRKAISSRAGLLRDSAQLRRRAHREITLRPGGHSAKAVGDEGEAMRPLESAGRCQIALEVR